jgi:hypothetical protein
MRVKLKKIKIEEGYHFLLKATINGKESLLILDTGATNTVLDLSKKDLYKITTLNTNNTQHSIGIGKSKVKTSRGNKLLLSIGKKNIFFKPALIDLTSINQTYKKLKLPEIDGILGNDLLVKHHAIIDLPNKLLFLKDN